MNNIIIVGCSGHAKVVIDIIEQENKYKIIGILDRLDNVGINVYGYSVIGTEEDLPLLVNKHNIVGGIIGIGDNFIRRKVSKRIKEIASTFQFINAIHPSSTVGKNVKMGVGNVLVAGARVNADAIIGDHCILNTNSSLGHEGIMKNYSSLSSNATIGGGAVIGECSIVALSATVLHNRKIGEHTVIGSGSLVVKDIPENVVAFGSPSKIIRKRNPGDRYL